jgi:ribonuclease J
MPMHGEYKMLKTHAKTGHEVGIPESNIFIVSNGDPVVLRNEEVFLSDSRIQTYHMSCHKSFWH